MYKHILIPTDGSELSAKAIRQGVDFARSINAQVTFITALPEFKVFTDDPVVLAVTPETYKADADRIARARLDQGEAYARERGVAAASSHVYTDRPFEAIVAAAPKNCDLIFMASHGRKGLKGFVLGSETQKVLSHTKIPVLVCR